VRGLSVALLGAATMDFGVARRDFAELKLLHYPKGIITSALSTLHSRGLEKKDEYWKGVITKIVDEW
jgi:hypothetical protein